MTQVKYTLGTRTVRAKRVQSARKSNATYTQVTPKVHASYPQSTQRYTQGPRKVYARYIQGTQDTPMVGPRDKYIQIFYVADILPLFFNALIYSGVFRIFFLGKRCLLDLPLLAIGLFQRGTLFLKNTKQSWESHNYF